MMIDTDAVTLARSVRIEDELGRRGIRLRRVGAEWIGPCPACGGRDRFSVNRRKQVFNCRGAGGGGVIDLVMHLDGCDFASAVAILTGINLDRGKSPSPPVRPDPAKMAAARAKAEEADLEAFLGEQERWWKAMRIWQEAVPIEDTPVDAYLRRRHLDIPAGISGRALRYHPACPFGQGTQPCMVSLIRSVMDSRYQGVHRTALRLDGTPLKIDGATARKALGSTRDGAIMLSSDAEVASSLHISEGIETTLAGMMAPRWWRPAWALLYAANIASFPVLAGIECLTIMIDHDSPDKHGRRAGQAAARECADRWAAAGREVIGYIPTAEGEDMADVAARNAAF
jgi:hypothetical protein